jgi:hypothetical protein
MTAVVHVNMQLIVTSPTVSTTSTTTTITINATITKDAIGNENKQLPSPTAVTHSRFHVDELTRDVGRAGRMDGSLAGLLEDPRF